MRFFSMVLVLLYSMTGIGQQLFQPLSFEQALKKAGEEGKIVLVQYESAVCQQCNEVASKGMQSAAAKEKLSKTFVCILISANHPDRQTIGNLYHIVNSFGTLFIEPNKTLILNYPRSSTNPAEYLNQADLALEKAGEVLKVNELEKEYRGGNRSVGFVEFYLKKRMSLHFLTDELLEEYTSLLPPDSLQSVRTLQFLASMEPVWGSKANEAMRRNQDLFNRAWYNLPLQQRVVINSAIISKSRSKAIELKNEKLAMDVATFAQSTFVGNYTAGAKAFEYTMMEFYRQTGDTAKYFTKAIGYYDRYYMSVSLDSIRHVDSINHARAMAATPAKDTVIGGRAVRKIAVSYAPFGQYLASDLNSGALNFYKMTNNPYLLSMATGWIKKALSFFESAEIWDSYARLLYKQQNRQGAVEAQQKVVELRTQRGFPVDEAQSVLEKMKKGADINDQSR
ncbi:MAG: hypothetical protein ACJ75B_15930 [Flavisolibacter sp.]